MKKFLLGALKWIGIILVAGFLVNLITGGKIIALFSMLF